MVFPINSIVEGAKSLVTPLIQPLFVPFLYWLLGTLGTIIAIWTNGDRLQDENEFINPLQPKPYDFIIVGAGSAGCLLANRLSRTYSVLLIEAGGEPNPFQFIPGFSLFFPNFPELDWQHRSVPQKYGSLMSVNSQSSWSTGLGLGGTGTLNYMIHLRGHIRDFNNWGNITGDPSWSWEGVLPYFKSHEDYEIPGDNVNHGYGGDLRIEAPDFPRTATYFVRAGGELGYPNVDLNAPFVEGFDVIRYPMRRGVRQAPYKAFLEPVRSRNTLTVMKFAQVNKILFKDGNVAYGVEYDRHGRTYVAHAKREVIVSAGTVGTPKLLMLSGIGPKSHLNEMNIPVLSDLPVGRNLQDHLSVYLAPFYIRRGLGYYLDRDLTIGEIVKWFTLGKGRLTNSGCEATGIFSSSFAKARGEGDWPDIQLFTYGITNFRDGAENVARVFNLKFDELRHYSRNDIGRDSIYLIVSGARPFARGYIQLGGSSPYDKPVIDPNYLGDPGETDLKVLLEAVKRTVYLMENTTAAGVEMGARFTTEPLPGCENLPFRSDEYWICFIRRFTVTLHHPVGTAALGSVVDTKLRVIGTRNLRVVDASVQPVLVVTNTQASTLMIAEKGSDMITRYWKGLDQGGKYNGNDKNPLFGLFGGKGGNGFGGGFTDNDNNIWWGNKKRDIVLDRNGSPQEFNFTRKDEKRQKEINELNEIFVERDYSIPPSGVPAKVSSPRVNEDLMKQKLQKSFQDLQMVSELARDNYNGHFKDIKSFTTQPTSPTKPTSTRSTTTGSSYSSSTTGRYRGTVRPTGNKWSQQNKEDEYYDDKDDGYASGDEDKYKDYEDEVSTRGGAVPRPPIAPAPPTPMQRPQGNQQGYYNTQEAITSTTGGSVGETRDYLRSGYQGNTPNSLNDIEQYFENSYPHSQLDDVNNF